ncbi:DUF1097 domain-containing protein [Pseudarthrobacter enclensis]|uniref:F0F1-type ATP synthase assembly protein I n=1 Tax=Pseudarthrobacter enclensis TaxID=993070 RepID=A0ABT9RZU5_9MICC|nr:DUF1097 domain-containing protein [Pseudarthrobacter enclensis]MDP9890767.1 F0F1-type ATP synthase assembly protein I [Pseudarthrobacter enclensis]
MKQYVGVGMSVGVLAGIWTQVSIDLGLVTWVAFIAWACFFAAGGGATGFSKGLAANLSGVVYGWLVGTVAGAVPLPGVLAVAIAVAALGMCLQAGWAPLSFIPGAFAGTAAYFGTALNFWGTLAALIIGAALGWLSAVLGSRIQSVVSRRAVTKAAGEETRPAAA